MTTIFKRSSSPYYYMKIKNPNGKWKMKSTGTRDRKLAQIIMNREEWNIWDESENRTIREIADEFLSYQEKRITVPYWEALKARLDDFVGWLNNRGISLIREIEYRHIEDFIDYRIEKGDGPITVNIKLITIKQVMRYAT